MWLPLARQLIVITFVFSPWVARVFAQDTVSLEAIDWGATLPQDRLVAQLGTKRVIFVGETHDRYDHHLNQFEIIKQLHQLDPSLAIGVEYFQQPFQAQVDDRTVRFPRHRGLRHSRAF